MRKSEFTLKRVLRVHGNTVRNPGQKRCSECKVPEDKDGEAWKIKGRSKGETENGWM